MSRPCLLRVATGSVAAVRTCAAAAMIRSLPALLVLLVSLAGTPARACPWGDAGSSGVAAVTAAVEESAAHEVPAWGRKAIDACVDEPGRVLAHREDYRLVDVRSPAQVARLRIPGAINLHPRDVVGSPFTADARHRVLLIGNAGLFPRLVRLCARTRAAGDQRFRVLAGGIRAWRRAGGAVQLNAGSGPAGSLEISARLVRELVHTPYTRFVTDATGPVPGVDDDRLVRLTGQTPGEMAEALSAGGRFGRPLQVVVLSNGGIDRGALRQTLLAAGLPEPLFYPGGLAPYRNWLRGHRKMLAQRSQPLHHGCQWN